MLTYDPSPGRHIQHAAEDMCALATANDDSVVATFNGIQIIAHPETTPTEVVRDYDEASERRRAEYLASPEGRLAAAAQEERARQNIARKGEIKAFPLHAILTLATGRVWGDFSKAHEAAEWLFGRGVQTIEFAFAHDSIRARALAALPEAASISETDCPTSPQDCAAKLAAQVARFGETVDLPRGDGQS